jgi:hypothetical protein
VTGGICRRSNGRNQVRKSTVLLCASAIALASCSTPTTWPWESGHAAPANPRKVLVSVVNGEIRVDQETAILRSDNGAMLWDLAPSAWGYRFGDGGIRFEYPAPGMPSDCRTTPNPAEFFDLPRCVPAANGRQFVCPRRDSHLPDACFKYTVKLQPEGGSPPVPDKDPWIKYQ